MSSDRVRYSVFSCGNSFGRLFVWGWRFAERVQARRRARPRRDMSQRHYGVWESAFRRMAGECWAQARRLNWNADEVDRLTDDALGVMVGLLRRDPDHPHKDDPGAWFFWVLNRFTGALMPIQKLANRYEAVRRATPATALPASPSGEGAPSDALTMQAADAGDARPGASAETCRWERSNAVWQIRYQGQSRDVPDAVKGLAYYARLLERPNQAASALAVEGQDCRKIPRRQAAPSVMDQEAVARARTRLAEIDEELREASEQGDAKADAELRTERDRICQQVSRAIGVGAKGRTLGNTEASKSAARVKSALRTVREKMRNRWGLPLLADHLEQSVSEVVDSFVYRPADPPPVWKVAY